MTNLIKLYGASGASELYEKLITKWRQGGASSVPSRGIDEEALSDHARVVYSSAFRRLHEKTQVFTLAKDAAVRTRLTHSIEVASNGRWIAQKVVDEHLPGLDRAHGAALVTLVETACLAHDIGNPPFGHFGEVAIQSWFAKNKVEVAGTLYDDRLEKLLQDLLQFDGNPQGLRILTRLQGRSKSERQEHGMHLTHSQLLTALKYPRAPTDQASRWHKPGFFESERSRIECARKELSDGPSGKLAFPAGQRFPLAYLVEAADDISYCLSDMEDGIDQGILTPHQVFEGIAAWTEKRIEDLAEALGKSPREVRKALGITSPAVRALRQSAERYSEDAAGAVARADAKDAKDAFMKFKTTFAAEMIREAARLYGKRHDEILDGMATDLLDGTDAHVLLEQLKGVARRILYPSDIVQRPFLAGRRVVHGILDAYGELLTLTRGQFALLRKAWRSPERGKVRQAGHATFLPLMDCLPPHYLDVYDSMKDRNELDGRCADEQWEWYCRAHLVVDYLSGMSDAFAHRTYLTISGASLG